MGLLEGYVGFQEGRKGGRYLALVKMRHDHVSYLHITDLIRSSDRIINKPVMTTLLLVSGERDRDRDIVIV